MRSGKMEVTWEEKRDTERERGYKGVHPVRGTGVWAMRAITGSQEWTRPTRGVAERLQLGSTRFQPQGHRSTINCVASMLCLVPLRRVHAYVVAIPW